MRGALEVRAGYLSLIPSPRLRGALHLRPLPGSGASPESVPAGGTSHLSIRTWPPYPALCVPGVCHTGITLLGVPFISIPVRVLLLLICLPMSLYLSSPVQL